MRVPLLNAPSINTWDSTTDGHPPAYPNSAMARDRFGGTRPVAPQWDIATSVGDIPTAPLLPTFVNVVAGSPTK
jgi:hypothetical protein